jgi:hypothetical protein
MPTAFAYIILNASRCPAGAGIPTSERVSRKSWKGKTEHEHLLKSKQKDFGSKIQLEPKVTQF